MEKVVDPDGVELARIYGDGLQDIPAVHLWTVSRDPMRGELQRVSVEVHQRHSGCVRRESAAIKEVGRAHPDVQMVRRDMAVVVLLEPPGRRLPDEAVGNAKHDEVVYGECSLRVDGLPGRDLLCRYAHESTCLGVLSESLHLH